MNAPITIIPTSVISGIDVPEDMQQVYINFMVKGLNNIYPTATEEQLLPVSIIANKAILIENGKIEGDLLKLCLESEKLFAKLEKELGLNITDNNEWEHMNLLIEDLIKEAGEEVRLYAAKEIAVTFFGPAAPGNIVINIGSIFNMKD